MPYSSFSLLPLNTHFGLILANSLPVNTMSENKMSERRERMKLQEGFTLIELLVALVIIGILASVAISQFSQFKNRANDTATQGVLHSVFTACKDYWSVNSSNSPCLLTTVSNTEHGFIPSADVEVTIDSNANNTEYDFIATASHISSPNAFAIDFTGVVNKFGGEVNRAKETMTLDVVDKHRMTPKTLEKMPREAVVNRQGEKGGKKGGKKDKK